MKYIPLIIVLLLILAILVLIFYGASRVKRFSRQIFGTDDIIQGVKKAQEDVTSTPRSVSAMTRIALPQIVSDFPDFQYDEMKQRAENALTQYLQAVTAQNVTILKEGGVTCPNCGAPITNLGAKFCEYCGAGIVELNVHVWSFENIEEA